MDETMNREFQQMRQQLNTLKETLDKQELVNEKMMRQVISSKTDSMQRKMRVSVIAAVFVIITSPFSFWWASTPFIVATDILMLYCIFRETLFYRQISNDAFSNSSMLEIAEKMIRFKRTYRNYTLIGILFLIPVWFSSMLMDMQKQFQDNTDLFYSMGIGAAVGLAIGAGIGIYWYLRITNYAEEIIRSIKE